MDKVRATKKSFKKNFDYFINYMREGGCVEIDYVEIVAVEHAKEWQGLEKSRYAGEGLCNRCGRKECWRREIVDEQVSLCDVCLRRLSGINYNQYKKKYVCMDETNQ